MTTPGGSAPDGAWVLGSEYGQDVTEQSFNAAMRAQNTDRGYREGHNLLQGLLGNIINMITTGISDLISAFFGNYTGSDQDLLDYQSAQIELNDRLDLLDDVAGYASAYVGSPFSLGTHSQASNPNSGTLVNFGSRLGPQKHARVENGGITFLQPGTWRIDCQLANSSNVAALLGGQPRIILDIQVWGKNGNPNELITRKFYRCEIPVRQLTASWNVTVVLPPEYFDGSNPFIRVRGWHNFNNTISMAHGSGFTSLTVNRWDLDATGPLNTVDNPGDL